MGKWAPTMALGPFQAHRWAIVRQPLILLPPDQSSRELVKASALSSAPRWTAQGAAGGFARKCPAPLPLSTAAAAGADAAPLYVA